MKKQTGSRLAMVLILHSSFFIHHFPKLAKGEIASLAGAADDPRYFQISLPVQPGCWSSRFSVSPPPPEQAKA